MKIHEIIQETVSAGGIGAGSIATVAKPLGRMQRRKPSIFASNKKKADADEQMLKDQVLNKMIRRNP